MLTLLFSLISTCQNCSGKVTLYLCQRFYFFQIIFQIFFFLSDFIYYNSWGRQRECIAICNHILPILQMAKLKNVLAKVMYYKVGAEPAQINHFPITSPEPFWFTPKIALKHGHVFEFHRHPQPWIVSFLVFKNYNSKEIALSSFWQSLNRNGRHDHHHERNCMNFCVYNITCPRITLN